MSNLIIENLTHEDGRPMGGTVKGIGCDISWQHGVCRDMEGNPIPDMHNGVLIEDVIDACVKRLEYYQASAYSCRENAIALTKLQEASHWLEHRTKDRIKRSVLGKYEK